MAFSCNDDRLLMSRTLTGMTWVRFPHSLSERICVRDAALPVAWHKDTQPCDLAIIRAGVLGWLVATRSARQLAEDQYLEECGWQSWNEPS